MSTPDAKEILSHPWEYYGAAAQPIYIGIYPPFYTDGFRARFGQEVEILNIYEGRRVYWFMRADQLVALAEKVLPDLSEEGWNFYERWQKEEESFLAFDAAIRAESFESLDDSGLRAKMRAYRKSFGPPFITNNVIEAISYYFQHHLVALLSAEGIGEERARSLMDAYGQAARPSYLKCAAEEYRGAKTEKEKEVVREKYYYIYNDYQSIHETTHQDLRALADSTPYAWAEELHTSDISQKAQALLTLMQVISTMQDVRKASFLRMVAAAKRFGCELARRSGISVEHMDRATWAEMEEGSVDADVLAKRGKCVMHWTLSGFTTVAGIEAESFITELKSHLLAADTAAQEVKGICASKGSASGRVVVVHDTSEFGKVQEGDILVTVMTRPEFLPVMHRAAAFICDEGGLTSHAAIVAREMKKPCVIATRVGTQVFKDGDMVEVDAEKGVVRKV